MTLVNFKVTDTTALTFAEQTFLTDETLSAMARSIDATANPTREELDAIRQGFYNGYNQQKNYTEKVVNEKIDKEVNKLEGKRAKEGADEKSASKKSFIDEQLLQLNKLKEMSENSELEPENRREVRKTYEFQKKFVDELFSMSDTVEFLEGIDSQKDKAVLKGLEAGMDKSVRFCEGCQEPSSKLDKLGITLRKCSRCSKVWYCSEKCQKKDWKSGHKGVCVDIKAGASKTGAKNKGKKKSYY